jgi:hypothetical protein
LHIFASFYSNRHAVHFVHFPQLLPHLCLITFEKKITHLTTISTTPTQVTWFEGGWADYESYQRQKSGGPLTPHRVKFRRLASV